MTGSDGDADSLRKLTESAARWISSAAGTAIECAAVLYRQRTCLATVGSTPGAARLAASEDEHGDGPAALGSGLAAPAVVGQAGSRWPAYRRRLLDSGFGAAVAVPLDLQPGSVGCLLFLAPPDYAFTAKVINEAAWFSEVASRSLTLALDVHGIIRAGDNLKQVLESRTSIDVACGI
ncbi:MAG: antitermination regulator, partial [Actinomycetes bacterium]